MAAKIWHKGKQPVNLIIDGVRIIETIPDDIIDKI